MAYPGNQQALKDIWWILCSPSGRKYLAELIGGAAADKTLNTPIIRRGRGAELGGKTSLASSVAWDDDHTIQTLSAVAASTAKDGATVEEIQAAVKAALAEGVVKVDISVATAPTETDQ